MFFVALATDYDGTLADLGVVANETIEALKRLRQSGRKLILVTGRELEELKDIFEELTLFDRVVAENGALIYDPATETVVTIAPQPPADFVAALRDRKVSPLSVGRAIVSTWEPNEQLVLETIREMDLDLQITFNKGAVMVLPAGINKATGLATALKMLDLSPHNVVAVGDAENDHAFLRTCGCAVAVANALPKVKESADLVTRSPRGAGVVELVTLLCERDIALVAPARHGIEFGRDSDGAWTYLEATDSVLIAGKSGIGKSSIAAALTERMAEKKQQFLILDPEGDYRELESAVCVGDAKTAPIDSEVSELLRRPDVNVVACALAVPPAQRPAFFMKLLPKIAALRLSTGRPHWLIVDEAHHALPVEHEGLGQMLPNDLPATVLITVHPDSISPQALKTLEVVVAVGEGAPRVVATCCGALGVGVPDHLTAPGEDEVLFWRCNAEPPRTVKAPVPRQARKRHDRKYAAGELGLDRSFYFRGPHGALNLRAQNLMIFTQIADGVDDATWEHHLRRGEYSAWLRKAIKNDELADEVSQIERESKLSAKDSRARVADAILRRYTAPTRDPDR